MSKNADLGKTPSGRLTADEYALVAAQEEFIVHSQVLIHGLLCEKGLSHADLAYRLGVSEARVSQMFSDSAKNLTMRTIAKIMHVLGEAAVLTTRTAEAASAAEAVSVEAVAPSALSEWWQQMKVVPLREGSRRSNARGLRLPADLSTIRTGADNDDYAEFKIAA